MWRGVIVGQPCSKSNSRQLVTIRKRPAFIKSKAGLAYERDAIAQITPPAEPFLEDVIFTATIYYASRRPDLDESLILDVLQKAGVYKNDRQVKEKHVFWGLDRNNPRAEITVRPMDLSLPLGDAA